MTNVMDQVRPPAAAAPGRTPAGVRALWKVVAAVFVVAGIGWGTFSVVTVLAHEERVETSSYPAAALRSIDVSNSSGSVRIIATDGDTIDVRAEISEGLRATGERQEVIGDVLELRGTCPNVGSDWCRVSYTISVPRSLDVVVDADDGSVEVTGTAGAVDLDTDNGSVEVSGLTGEFRASNDNGRIEASGLRSPIVEADTDNGRVSLQFVAAPTRVVASTDNGSVEVVVPDDGEHYDLDMETGNGSRDQDVLIDSSSSRSIFIRSDNGSVAARTATS